MAEQSLKEFYDSLIGASTNWHKIEYNWRDVACVFAFAVSGLYTFSSVVAGSFGHNILWLVIFSVTDPHGADPPPFVSSAGISACPSAADSSPVRRRPDRRGACPRQ